jgi:bla regulator protein BlaR1
MTVLSPFANHLWQSTLFAAAAALLAIALHRQRAETRYRLWLAASLKFLIPLAPLIDFGSQLQWRAVAQAVPTPASAAIAQLGQPFAAPVAAAVAPDASSWLPTVLAIVWLTGCSVAVWRWFGRWRVVRAAVRVGEPLPIAAPVRVLSSPARLEPGIFGVWRPVLLLPAGIEERLTPEQLRAILAHEFCHARRRDNLSAAAHMAVETLFWFHPLVWWIGARLVDERERACDEDVVRCGNDPTVYASGILDVCRFYLESPLPCAPGVTGADLQARVRTIMTGGRLARLTLAHKALLASAALAAIAAPIAIGILQAQSRPPLRFEVASIKRQKRESMKGSLEQLPGGGLRMGGVTVKGLIAMAYDVREEQVIGGPKWLDQESYSLLAKAERAESTTNQPAPGGPGSAPWDRMRERLRTLLAERCRLAVRTDSKATSGYELVPAKGGSKLTETTNPLPPGTMRNRGEINGRSGTMHMLASVLTNYVGKPVVDRTGLTGSYDYKLKYADDLGGPDATVTEGASIFTALQEQLGLKLEPGRVAVQTIVVERVEKPSEN